MGLHLNWELRLPGAMSRDDVLAYVRDPHEHTSNLTFDEITPVIDGIGGNKDDELTDYFWTWARVISRPHPELDSSLIGDVHLEMPQKGESE